VTWQKVTGSASRAGTGGTEKFLPLGLAETYRGQAKRIAEANDLDKHITRADVTVLNCHLVQWCAGRSPRMRQ